MIQVRIEKKADREESNQESHKSEKETFEEHIGHVLDCVIFSGHYWFRRKVRNIGKHPKALR